MGPVVYTKLIKYHVLFVLTKRLAQEAVFLPPHSSPKHVCHRVCS